MKYRYINYRNFFLLTFLSLAN